MDPPLEEEERVPLDCEFQPIPDSPKIEDLVGSGEFESSGSLREEWLAIILTVVVAKAKNLLEEVNEISTKHAHHVTVSSKKKKKKRFVCSLDMKLLHL
jgi:gamma-glutamyl phosphate reductase